MKKIAHLSLFITFMLLFWSCSDNSTGNNSEGNLESANSQKNFVWNAMNFWYYWQEQVPKLSDNKSFFESDQDFQNYLMGFSDAEAVFEDLLFNNNNFSQAELAQFGEDDFSFFIDDYEAFLESRQGISQDFGFEYGLVRYCQDCTEIFGYVQYVLDDRPADNAGLTRGDIFTQVNGTALTVSNYQSVLANPSYELTLAEPADGELIESEETVTINSAEIVEDPIYLSKVIDTGAAKVGYLMYNSFQTNSHENLNNVFGEFNAEGIDELVLDLRYNGGGAVITSATLASMISGLPSSEEFAEYTFNSKRSNQGSIVRFQEQVRIYGENGNGDTSIDMNKLSIDRLYVLTGFGTASASEAIINGLNPFMEVILIGRQTVGKDDASITLFDSPAPYTDETAANTTHKNAIQPIVLKVQNSVGESNGEGFMPVGANFIREIDFLLQNGDLPALGDENDPLLARALQLITGEPVAKALAEPVPYRGEIFRDSRDLEQFGKDMYVLPNQ